MRAAPAGAGSLERSWDLNEGEKEKEGVGIEIG